MRKEDFVGYDAAKYNPIIRPKSEQILKEVASSQQPKKALEIGSYIGYSAAVMLDACSDLNLITLEKDAQNAEYARENLKRFGERAKVVCCDAAEFLSACDEQFDLIFLDGPKGQYAKYLPHLKRLLAVGGTLVADDILFHGYVQDGHVLHKHRTIVESLKKFSAALQQDKDFECIFFNFEDGLAVCKKIR